MTRTLQNQLSWDIFKGYISAYDSAIKNYLTTAIYGENDKVTQYVITELQKRGGSQ